MIPAQESFPYTLRLVSEVLSSNGSTSMASVCGSTLALMDAGVPIKAPVAGIAMGLITDGEVTSAGLRYAILTDIQGLEDHLGDMDFKVAGTEHGITALQMDIKIHGLTYEILEEALAQAREGRLFIMGKMLAVLPEPRKSLSAYAPRILTIAHRPREDRQGDRPRRQDDPRPARAATASRSTSTTTAPCSSPAPRASAPSRRWPRSRR